VAIEGAEWLLNDNGTAPAQWIEDSDACDPSARRPASQPLFSGERLPRLKRARRW
jgi:hypothetical protein